MKNLARIFSIAMISAVGIHAQASVKIRWACIGNSITAGPTGANNAYPVRLGTHLIMDSILNAGVGWMTALKSGDSSYWTHGKLPAVFAFQPDIISIKLGTNDSKPINWKDSANFSRDYLALVDTLLAMPSHPRIFLIYPTPVFTNENVNPQPTDLIRQSVIRGSIIPKIRAIAILRGLDTIDLNTPFLNQSNLFNTTDYVHPTTAGSNAIGDSIFKAYISKVTRIAVVGNSITEYINSGITGAVAVDAYSMKLNMLLGRNYYVENEGRSGCYAQKPGNITPAIMSYWTQSNGKLQAAFALKPHIMTIMLGTNDSRPKAWNTARYMTDYKALIDTFSNNISPKPKIWLVKPMGAWKVNGAWGFSNPTNTTDNGISGDIIRDSVVPAVTQIAADKGLSTIDLFNSAAFSSTTEPTAITNKDGVHPNKAGSDTIAHIFFRTMALPVTAIQSAVSKDRVSSPEVRLIRIDHKAIPKGALENAKVYTLDGKTMQEDGAPAASGVYVTKPVPVDEKKKPEGK